MLEAAERLYALKGVDAASIRQINAEAGQKNGSAVHNHFGSREGLIDAILELRTGARDKLRLEMLDALKEGAGDALPAIRGVAEAMVRPQFEELTLGARTCHRRFVKQVHQRHELMDKVLSNRHDLGLRDCFRLIRRRLPEAPTPILHHRCIHANANAIDSAANLEERLDIDPDSLTEQRIALHIECCIDSIAGVFTAPISAAAAALVGDRDKASPALERWRDRAVM
ncbi:TetR/AcrR family transcriptional regulator [Rhodovulum sp. DZ06]|uniref:TetR/AcrR family transcriptional regulator n=1 Tax=Rhodovulum sp. DZ06 TaxID=3425126 RepID=UPI003D3348A5